MPGSHRQGSRARIGLAIALIAGLALRVAPLAYTGMPLDNDSWYIHYDVRVLRASPDEALLSSPRYDGYNNYWPGAILLAHTLTMTTGQTGLAATHLAGPLSDGLALVPFYALARRLSPGKAWQATLLVATAPSMVGLGLGLVKEAVARPILYSTLLASAAGASLALAPLALGLAVAHHLTSTLTVVILLASPLMASLLHSSTGAEFRGPRIRDVAVVAGATVAWIALVPPSSWKRVFTLFDPASLAFYTLALTMLAPAGAVLVGERPGRASTWVPTIILAGLITVAATRGLSPGIQPLGASAVYYMLPVALLAPLTAGALSNLKRDPGRQWSPIPYAWTFPLAGIVAYLALTAPLGQSPAGRVANLVLPGLALLYAYSGSRLLDAKAVATLLVSILYIQALLSGADPEAFDLPYHGYEYTTTLLASTSTVQVYADSKIRDLAYYHGLETAHPIPAPQGPTIIYEENLVHGYKLDSNLRTGDPAPITELLATGDRLLDTGHSWIAQPHS